MSDDDDDPVVEEIPVYLTHSLADRLYVFQYPVVPCTNSGLYNVVKSKIKPDNGEVALDLGLDTTSSNFDQKHAEQIASAVDHNKPSQERFFSKKMMDKIFLESTRVVTDCDSFGIGLMHGRELHISPIRSIISLTPSYKHIFLPKEEENEDTEENSDNSSSTGGPTTATSKVNPRKNSYSNYMKKLAQESWYNTDYFDPNTPKAEAERVSLCRVECRSGVWLSSEGWELAAPSSALDYTGEAKLGMVGALSPLSLGQLPTALGLPPSIPLDDLLPKALTQSVIVRGFFLPRSDLVYPPDSLSYANGIKGDVMARARDYILYQLNEGKGLNRLALSEVIRIPQEEVDEIIENIAVKHGQQWVFKYPPDTEFINRYGHIVEQQKMLWEARYKQVMECFESSCGGGGGGNSPRTPRRRRESEGGGVKGRTNR